MQDFRVQRGAAVKAEVLQAKNALAGAVAARVMAQGNYELASNDFENKFGFVPQNAELLLPINMDKILKNGFGVTIIKLISPIKYLGSIQ